MDLNDNTVAPSNDGAQLIALADEAKRDVETQLGFRLSLLTIDPVNECFNLFHLPSTTVRLIEHATSVAEEIYPQYEERIKEATQGAAD